MKRKSPAKKQLKKKPKKKVSRTAAKKTKRSRIDLAALKSRYNSKVRQEVNDYDYLNQLSRAELEWLNTFTAEYTNAEVGSQKKATNNQSGNKFHKKKSEIKACQKRNNDRNNDAYGISKAKLSLSMVPQEYINNFFGESKDVSVNETEDALIAYMDEKAKRLKRSKW